MENNADIKLWKPKGDTWQKDLIDSKGNAGLSIIHVQKKGQKGFIPCVEGPEYVEYGHFYDIRGGETEAYDAALSQGMHMLTVGYEIVKGRS